MVHTSVLAGLEREHSKSGHKIVCMTIVIEGDFLCEGSNRGPCELYHFASVIQGMAICGILSYIIDVFESIDVAKHRCDSEHRCNKWT
jgi:hypothetical protein